MLAKSNISKSNISKPNIREADILEKILPYVEDGERLLDVGCGKGKIAKIISQKKDVLVVGAEIYDSNCCIDCKRFDGCNLPFKDSSFNTVVVVDVIHHADDGLKLLNELCRVASKKVIIRDHYYSSWLGLLFLKFVDWTTNIIHGVSTPFNFRTKKEWEKDLASLPAKNLKIEYYPKFGIKNIVAVLFL